METNRQAKVKGVFTQHKLIRIVAFFLTLLLALTLCGCGGEGAATSHFSAEPRTVYGTVDADGTAYLPVMNGTTVTLQGNIRRAMLLKDRTTIIVLEKDGRLYTTTVSAAGEKTVIADDAASIEYVAASGVVYRSDKENYFRYLFSDESTVALGKNITSVVGTDSLSLLLADDQGKIYLLPEGAAEPEKIGSFEDTILPIAVSNDGKTAVWVEKNTSAETHTICLYTNENCNRLETVDSRYSYVNAQFNHDETFLAVADSYASNLYFAAMGDEDITTAKLGNELYFNTVYTKNGLLRNDAAQTMDGLYALVTAESSASIYYISPDGDREKVAGNVTDMEIAGGRLYYLDDENNLYTGKLHGSELQEENKIAGDVNLFKLSPDGRYAYYLKNGEENVGMLSRYNASRGESEKVSSNAYSYLSDYWSSAYFYVSEDGKSVYFFEDVEEHVGGSYSSVGTLKCATEGEDAVKIATDVIATLPDSALEDSYVRSNSFTFEKYLSADGDGNLMVNWMYYNGTESQTIAKDVYHS